MSASPLDPASVPIGPDRSSGRGHGIRDLGPSDSSDNGSDVRGAARRLGDADLDSDSDRFGTGERTAATPDVEGEPGKDIAPDRVEEAPLGETEADSDEDNDEVGEG
jgi:hypothetical protein